jgi:hypothetical protein
MMPDDVAPLVRVFVPSPDHVRAERVVLGVVVQRMNDPTGLGKGPRCCCPRRRE